MYRQRVFKNHKNEFEIREKTMGYVEEEVKKAVVKTAKKFDVSESFVVNTMLAAAFGITIREKYYEVRNRHGKKAKAHS